MSLPTSGSADDVRQMIEARLTEMSKESQQIQVLVREESGRTHLELQDADGPFLNVEPEEEQTEHADEGSSHSGSEQEEEEDLESALQESRELVAKLR